MNELKNFCVSMANSAAITGEIRNVTFTNNEGRDYTGADSIQAMADNISVLNGKQNSKK